MATLASASAPITDTALSSASKDKYRGAVVEDLQLPPAFCLPSSEAISRAIELAYDRDFTHIPVLNSRRRPVGYVDVPKLKEQWEAGKAHPNDKVADYMSKFRRTASIPYALITPVSCLSELEEFLKSHDFALVTDNDRKFVLAVATQQDLNSFVTRRGF